MISWATECADIQTIPPCLFLALIRVLKTIQLLWQARAELSPDHRTCRADSLVMYTSHPLALVRPLDTAQMLSISFCVIILLKKISLVFESKTLTIQI